MSSRHLRRRNAAKAKLAFDAERAINIRRKIVNTIVNANLAALDKSGPFEKSYYVNCVAQCEARGARHGGHQRLKIVDKASIRR